jgi:hypothetical protein
MKIIKWRFKMKPAKVNTHFIDLCFSRDEYSNCITRGCKNCPIDYYVWRDEQLEIMQGRISKKKIPVSNWGIYDDVFKKHLV